MGEVTQHFNAGSKYSSIFKILGAGSHPLSYINLIDIAMNNVFSTYAGLILGLEG